MSKSKSKNEAKLKASVEELVGPLLERIENDRNFKNNVYWGTYYGSERESGGRRSGSELIKELGILAGATKDLTKKRQNLDSELIACLGAIERAIDSFSNKREENIYLSLQLSDLTKILKELLKKHGHRVDPSVFRKTSGYEAFGDGTLLTSNNQDGDGSLFPLEKYTKGLDHADMYLVYSLRLFPENVILKKRLLIHWWSSLNMFVSGERIFNSMVQRGILEPGHTEHQVTDQWKINPTCHRHLNRLPNHLVGERHIGIGHAILFCTVHKEYYSFREWTTMLRYRDRKYRKFEDLEDLEKDFDGNNFAFKPTVLLNGGQMYLNSEHLKKVLDDDNFALRVVLLGNWFCIDLKSHYHIEVDDTEFLKKLGRYTRWVSLRGISRIEELPQSIGKLPNLRILDLRACHDLQKLPQKPQSNLCQGKWFNSLTHLDMSECWLLNHMPKWIGELYWLQVLKGFVVSNRGDKNQFCRLRDLSKLLHLKKLNIRITKHLGHEDVSGLESMDQLSVLSLMWSTNEYNNDNESGKVPTIYFPRNLEKLDLRCYPAAEIVELNPTNVLKLKKLYIRGGKLTKIKSGFDVLVILRLRFLDYLEMDWFALRGKFTKLEYVEYERCPLLKNFPKNRSTWNMKDPMADPKS